MAGCGPDPSSAPTPTVTPAAASAPVSAAEPVGSGQDVRTPELAARVTVDLADGDPATIRVTVRVLRGTYEFGPAQVRLRNATGPDTAPLVARSTPPVGLTLHVGVTRTWQIPFGRAAATGAQIQVTSPAGTVLAWTTA
ncbi:hypothetical protein L3i22_027880 [Actinoplanes sp. L3-i22]|nr:hypothetical protein L3i22_027880 [Actinoplanes sp. L3-i22]